MVIIGVPRGVVMIRRGLYANSEVRLKPDFAVLEYQYLYTEVKGCHTIAGLQLEEYYQETKWGG